jgi:hypothetical protein
MSILDEPLRRAAADPASRDGANELYDRACDLLLAAEGIRNAAAEPDWWVRSRMHIEQLTSYVSGPVRCWRG